jgi:putative heme iron utilization protein
MTPDADFNAPDLARSLLRRSRRGALATLMPGSGDPYCSLVNLATDSDGAPLLLISRLALHTRNILADPRISLMLDERRAGDPLEGARIMLGGVAGAADAGPPERWGRRYLAAHPSAEVFVKFKDFLFFAVRITTVHLVAGFGRIVDLSPAEVLTDLDGAGALLDAEAEIVDHMNADHRETMNLYATRLLGAEAGDWRCTGCDPEGIDLQNGQLALRLAFPRRIVTPQALRAILKDIAERSRTP